MIIRDVERLNQEVRRLRTLVNHLLAKHDVCGGIPGEVRYKIGGRLYRVALYESGMYDRNGNKRNPTREVDCVQMQIDEHDTIPHGTAVFVSLVGGVYHMQVPVWL